MSEDLTSTDFARKNSIFNQMMKCREKFTEEDLRKIAEGQIFLSKLKDDLKYKKDLRLELSDTLRDIAEYFHLDRIVILETDLVNGTNSLNYQWNCKEENTLVNYFETMTDTEIVNTIETYNKNGYIEVNPAYQIMSISRSNKRIVKNFVMDILLGAQIWIPTLRAGKYSGAVMFDKYDTAPYTVTEKYLLSEVVSDLAVYIDRLHAEDENKAKSNFLSTMSHELRTPMNAVLGMTEVALREEMTPSVRKCMKTVQSSAFGLLTLINDILDYSKIEAGRLEIVPEEFQTLSLVNDMYEISKARNDKNLELRLHMPENLPTLLYGDMVRIKQVMLNLCSNALKYTDYGSVDIRVETQEIGENQCRFSFSVKDTGIGIRKEDLHKLFKQYGQVDKTVNHHKEGTGLGLMISKQLIENMNGKIFVDSVYGEGSVFSFQIPLEVRDWSPAGTLESYLYTEEKKEGNHFVAPDAKILIVDDSPINLMVAEALLSPIGMNVELAESGREALEKIADTTYDLIMMDHFMPEMDGLEVVQRIRDLEGNPNQKVPIIALTADAMKGVKEEMLAGGMDDFLSKPMLLDKAYEVLRRWLPSDKILPV